MTWSLNGTNPEDRQTSPCLPDCVGHEIGDQNALRPEIDSAEITWWGSQLDIEQGLVLLA